MHTHNIKLILTDLDATLLRDDKTVSDYTLSIINQAMEKGIQFFPATARAHRVLKRMNILNRIPHDGLIILNGSRIMLHDTVIYEQGISPKERDETLKILKSTFPTQRISVELNDTMYVNHNIWEVDPTESNYILTDFSELPDSMASRIIIGLDSLDDYPRLQACLPNSMYTHNIEGTPLCRVLHKSVSKAKAIEHLCSVMGYSKDEIVCFGDDLNDLEMFEFCTTSIAMSNALDEVKLRATEMTLSNNEDGVARWIEEHLLKA